MLDGEIHPACIYLSEVIFMVISILCAIISIIVIIINIILQYKLKEIESMLDELSYTVYGEDYYDSQEEKDKKSTSMFDVLVGKINNYSDKKSSNGQFFNSKADFISHLSPDNTKVYDTRIHKVRVVSSLRDVELNDGREKTKQLLITFSDGSTDIFEKERYRQIPD